MPLMEYHKPALLKESIEGLSIDPDGCYVDATFGGGGHARAILNRLSSRGKLFAFDQDSDAEDHKLDDSRFVFIQQNFAYMSNFLQLYDALPVDGILADLGVSFHQFDRAERGFSFRFSGPLDMRMNQSGELTAATVVNTYEPEKLKNIFKAFGELHNAKQLAAKIVNARSEKPIETVEELKNLLSGMVAEKHSHKFLAQVFQSIRIEVNQELKAIEVLLQQLPKLLSSGGRAVIITYHSLEDRLVKNFFRTGNIEGKVEKDFYGNLIRPLNPVNRKPITPTEEEIKDNNRARSAKLRIAEKIK